MLRRAVLALCACVIGLCLGCGSSDSQSNNPNNLDYNKEGPPKRGAPPASKNKK